MTQLPSHPQPLAAISKPSWTQLPEPPQCLTATEVAGEGRLWQARPMPTDQREQVLATRDALRERLVAARRGAVIAHLARLSAHYARERSAEQWQIVFEDYAEDLSEFPEVYVRNAIARWRQSNPFWPRAAELRGLMLREWHRDQELLRRAEVLLGERKPSPLDLRYRETER